MPFTLSHPFIVLPLHRYRLLHFPALVIGAMSPDFPYYLHGRPYPGGHSWPSVLYYDVLLTALVYLLALALLSPCLRRYLPDCLNAAYPPPAHFSRRWWYSPSPPPSARRRISCSTVLPTRTAGLSNTCHDYNNPLAHCRCTSGCSTSSASAD